MLVASPVLAPRARLERGAATPRRAGACRKRCGTVAMSYPLTRGRAAATAQRVTVEEGVALQVLSDGSLLFNFGLAAQEAGWKPAWDAASAPHLHLIGVGGIGMSGIARLALARGWRVSGSDIEDSDILRALANEGVHVKVGHSAENLWHSASSDGKSRDENKGGRLPDAVVASSAVPSDNPELVEARASGVAIYKRGQWLSKLTDSYDVIAVAGTHGKTTTSAMLSLILRDSGDDITALIGGLVPQFPGSSTPGAGNVVIGSSRRLVLEADEYDEAFLGVTPVVGIINNVEWEHVDKYPSEQDVLRAFEGFARRVAVNGMLLICTDDPGAKAVGLLLSQPPANEQSARMVEAMEPGPRAVVTFGTQWGADWQAIAITPNIEGGTDFVAVYKERPLARVRLPVPGLHNVLNALAAVAASSLLAAAASSFAAAPDGHWDMVAAATSGDLGIIKAAAERAAATLSGFKGVRRRFELVGEAAGFRVYDDYAHHPTEVRAVIQGAMQRHDGNPVWIVFQPHTLSRLQAFMKDFSGSFEGAARVIVTETFAARSKVDSEAKAVELRTEQQQQQQQQPQQPEEPQAPAQAQEGRGEGDAAAGSVPDAEAEGGDDAAAAFAGSPAHALSLAIGARGVPAVFVPTLEGVVERLAWDLKGRSALNVDETVTIVTVGAGDITTVGPMLMHKLGAERPEGSS